jgi:DNA-directed RNA polymerase subunit RPC12/RpoP
MSSITCPQCGVENPSTQWACSACGSSFARRYDETLRPTRCPVCGGELEPGQFQVRTAGAGGIGTLVDAGLTWTFETVLTATCIRCGHIDLYAR